MKKLFFIAALAMLAVGGAFATNENRLAVWGADGNPYDCETGPIECNDQQYYEDESMKIEVNTDGLSRFP